MNARLLAGALVLLASGAALAEPTTILNRRIQPGQTLGHALHAVPLPDAEVDAVIASLKGVFDFTKVRPGDQLRLVLRNGELDSFGYRAGPLDEWQVRRDGDHLMASKCPVEVETKLVTVELDIQSSLYEAALAAGESPDIALSLADVFAWDIDFHQDVRKGDRVRAVIEKVVSRGRHIRYGEMYAASYRGEQVGEKRVFRYQFANGMVSWFQQDGSSARKSFLKSPLKYTHVTSGFGNRFHPVLQYFKEHNGVDYQAAIGTPVWAVSDGTVTRAGNFGPNGNLVCLKHLNGFETCYAHLSKLMVRNGQHVSQKQVIALTGSTGRSTGPHLHFALKRSGAFLNPLNQKFPRAEPIPKDQLARYRDTISPYLQQLDATDVAMAK